MPNYKYKNEDEYYKAEMRRMIGLCSVNQQKTLNNFLDWYGNKISIKTGNRIALKTKWNNIQVLHFLGRFLKGKDFKNMTLEDGEAWLKSLKGKKATSLANWKVIVRYFFKWLYGVNKKHEFPGVVDSDLWHTPRRPKPERVTNKEDVLTKDEKLLLKANALNFMDRVKIVVGMETGFRAGEMVALNYKDVQFDDKGAKIWTPKSKSTKHYSRVVDCVPDLKKWINLHAFKKPDSPLFYGQRAYHGRRLHASSLSQMLKQCARRAGIDTKRVWWHSFRHGSVSDCRNLLHMDVDFIAKRHGITPDTVRKVYLHYEDEDVDREYLIAKGNESEEDKVKRQQELQKTAPKLCSNCNTLNPTENHFCDKCLEPLDYQGFIMKDEQQQNKMDALEEAIAKQNALLLSMTAKLEGYDSILSKIQNKKILVNL